MNQIRIDSKARFRDATPDQLNNTQSVSIIMSVDKILGKLQGYAKLNNPEEYNKSTTKYSAINR